MARTRRATNHTPAEDHKERFSLHFPRLFAFVYGVTGNEEVARETTTASFASILPGASLSEHDFTIALYAAARRLMPKKSAKTDDGLTGQEREVLSLLFDAQLTRGEVSELLGFEPDDVLVALVDGLKKLRDDGPVTLHGHKLQTLSA